MSDVVEERSLVEPVAKCAARPVDGCRACHRFAAAPDFQVLRIEQLRYIAQVSIPDIVELGIVPQTVANASLCIPFFRLRTISNINRLKDYSRFTVGYTGLDSSQIHSQTNGLHTR